MKFEPWIGECYGSSNSLGLPARLLVLGESHYGARGRPSITREVVGEVFGEDVPYRYRFFTSIFKALCGAEREPRREALEEFCHAIAFYNFIQEMIDAPGVRPSEEAWAGGIAPFFGCLDMLKPSHVVACGFRLWNNLPSECYKRLAAETERDILGRLPDRYKASGRTDPGDWVGRYAYDGASCLILRIKHPSVAFSAAQWRPLLRSFFQLEVDSRTLPAVLPRDSG